MLKVYVLKSNSGSGQNNLKVVLAKDEDDVFRQAARFDEEDEEEIENHAEFLKEHWAVAGVFETNKSVPVLDANWDDSEGFTVFKGSSSSD